MMIGIELTEPVAEELVLKALDDGLVINKVSPNILRLLPPLIISKKDIDIFLKWFDINIGKISKT
ncbi:MAG: Acetylornithine aminotransferase [Actinobacteria bacterium ADurb.Bin346]|nr:MAG: Acetylornithine aminotransferase [Actinobacteria bacterium ADurb.Bin346]